MQVIIFNEEMKRIEHFTNCTWQHIKNYLQVNSECRFIGVIDYNDMISGEAVVEDYKIFFGKSIDKRKLRNITINFDFVFFNENIDIINSQEYINLRSNIIENLIHIYNGGSVDSVPFPMPVTKTIETTSTEFIKEAEQDIQIYTVEQAIEQFISKLK